MFGTRRNTFTEPLPPVPLPFAMWKQPFSRGHFLGFHPDAWHSWQIGCGSEGDGLWKHCPCLQPTHCRHIHKGRLTRRYMTAARVRTQSHTRRSRPPCPTLETKREVACCKQGGDLDVKHTKTTGNLNKSWLPSTWTPSPLRSFVFSTYELHFCLAATFGKIKSRSWVFPRMKFTWNVQLCSSFSTHTLCAVNYIVLILIMYKSSNILLLTTLIENNWTRGRNCYSKLYSNHHNITLIPTEVFKLYAWLIAWWIKETFFFLTRTRMEATKAHSRPGWKRPTLESCCWPQHLQGLD